MPYTTAAAVKTYLGITSSTDDALLTSLIERAQASIDRYTHRTFEAASDTTKRFDAEYDTSESYTRLDWTPYGLDLCQITSVVNGDGTTISASSYVTEPRNETPYFALKLKVSSGLYFMYDNLDDHENAIQITGRWAYSITAPAEIVSVCIEMVALMYKRRDSNSDINRPVIAGNATILPAGLSRESIDILTSLKRIR
jgi:hypothetical protein